MVVFFLGFRDDRADDYLNQRKADWRTSFSSQTSFDEDNRPIFNGGFTGEYQSYDYLSLDVAEEIGRNLTRPNFPTIERWFGYQAFIIETPYPLFPSRKSDPS